jgi:hypothetical protein
MPKINIRHFLSSKRVLAFAGLGFLIFLSNSNSLSAQSVLQGYSSDEKLQRGMLVAGKDGDDSKVVALTDKTAEKFKGVIVEQNDSPVTISNDDRKIFVATVGPYEVLVSNENGKIKRGDYIGISSSSGIGAKATEFQPYVIGVAASDFEGGGDSIGTTKTQTGQNVQFGRIKVDVSFGRNPVLKIPEKDRVPDALQKLARSVADKPVSSTKIYLGLAVFLGTAIISGTMLYSGTRSSIISIGRNPLSKASIYRGLIQVVLLSLIVFITGLFGVYLLLKL